MEDEEVRRRKRERERRIKKQENKLSQNQIKSNHAADPPFGLLFFLFSGSLPLCHVVLRFTV
jgi:hypothetical protein